MATDIQDLMAKAQQVINTNVETVKETRITQDTLQKNIEITDEKIGIHNVDEQAHLNIRSENNGGDEIGTIKWFAMDKAPAGYLVCNGAALLTSEYPKLYNAIGHKFQPSGKIAESNTFYLPNLINRVPWGSSDSVGTVKNAGLPNITGALEGAAWSLNDKSLLNNCSGAFTQFKIVNNGEHCAGIWDQNAGLRRAGTRLNASMSSVIYGRSDTVQPPALCLLPCIRCDIYVPSITNLTTTLPTIIGDGLYGTYPFTINGTENDPGITYEISAEINYFTFSKRKDIVNNENLQFIVTGAYSHDHNNYSYYNGKTIQVTITAVSPSGGRASVTHGIYIAKANTDNFALSLPKLIKPYTIYTVTASGILPDPNIPQAEQQTIAYTNLTCNNSNVTITKATDADSTFTVQTGGISRGNTVRFITSYTYFTYPKSDGSTFKYPSKIITSVEVNHLPKIKDATTLLKGPRLVNPNSTNTYTLEGATDPDGEAVTYSVAVNDVTINKDQITFSKSTGIADGEEFTLNCANVTEGTPIILDVTVTDTTGESISLVNQLGDGRIVVNTPPDLSGVQNGIFANTPVSDFPSCLIPNHDYTVTIPNITDVNGDTVSCNFSTQSDAFTFSPKTNIISGTNVTIHVNKNVIHGATYDFTFTANDSSGGSSSITVSRIINQLPNTDAVVNPIGIAGLKPSTTYNLPMPSGATDADSGQELTYHLSVDNPNITVNDYAGGHGPGSITIPDTSVIPRGTAVNLTMQVSDGLETVSKVFALYINNLPSGTLTHSVKSSMQGGANKAQTVTFSGITDSETVTYNLSGEGLTFSKSSGIAANESVTITAAKVAATTVRTLTVTPYDACGEAGTPVEIQITVEPIIIGLAPVISAPTEGQIIAGGTVTAICSEYSTGPDLS